MQMGDKWGIDAVVADPKNFYIDRILEVDGEVFEEVKKAWVEIARETDHSKVEMSIPFDILVNTEDGAAELRDYLSKKRLMKGV